MSVETETGDEYWKQHWAETMNYDDIALALASQLDSEAAEIEKNVMECKSLVDERLREMRDDLLAQKRELEERRITEVQKRKEKMLTCQYGPVVTFNVGGFLFECECVNLSGTESLLRLMLSGDIPSVMDEKGHIYIDRDGTFFQHILDYIENGKEYLINRMEEISEYAAFCLAEEMKFYGLKEGYETIMSKLGLITLNYGQNLLNSHVTGGRVRVVQYTWSGGASSYNDNTPNGGSGDSWQNNGMFINLSPYMDSDEYSYRTNTNTGSTWCNNGHLGVSTGILVADLTGSSTETCEISKFVVWSIF
eukprot:TRINITY_DN3979_c0_g1_i3.p1 TRINITY_DN3979_c0_g1~~TRINITY_DN3979_c0_g1_i3.p1  ORF type:complete len:314 (-),score=79.00 TRINITY_DN3979_c0_g1_i3:927-1847(-)